MPADPRKAGSDKGKLKEELKNLLTSVRLRKLQYEALLEDLSPEELKFDLDQYEEDYRRDVKPYLERALSEGGEEELKTAREIEKTYGEIREMIKKRLEELEGA